MRMIARLGDGCGSPARVRWIGGCRLGFVVAVRSDPLNLVNFDSYNICPEMNV